MTMTLKLVMIATVLFSVAACAPKGPGPINNESYYSPDAGYDGRYEQSYPDYDNGYYDDHGRHDGRYIG
jgi:predicted small lipoprotein YifL